MALFLSIFAQDDLKDTGRAILLGKSVENKAEKGQQCSRMGHLAKFEFVSPLVLGMVSSPSRVFG